MVRGTKRKFDKRFALTILLCGSVSGVALQLLTTSASSLWFRLIVGIGSMLLSTTVVFIANFESTNQIHPRWRDRWPRAWEIVSSLAVIGVYLTMIAALAARNVSLTITFAVTLAISIVIYRFWAKMPFRSSSSLVRNIRDVMIDTGLLVQLSIVLAFMMSLFGIIWVGLILLLYVVDLTVTLTQPYRLVIGLTTASIAYVMIYLNPFASFPQTQHLRRLQRNR